jgi:UrcA family protein
MKALKILVSFMSAVAVAAIFGSGAAFADDPASTEATSDIDEHIYAIGQTVKTDDVSVTVPFGDLNLDNEKGAAVLYSRLQRAAMYVCGVESYTVVRSLSEHADASACYSTTLSASVDKIDSAALKQIHENGEPAEMYAAKAK